jgi:chemotaxis-related protein WspB
MLMLVFRLGADRYALDATEIVEVLPRVPLKSVPGAPAWVAGLFSYRGRTVPVIDLASLALGRPSADHVSTRLVLVHYPAAGELSGFDPVPPDPMHPDPVPPDPMHAFPAGRDSHGAAIAQGELQAPSPSMRPHVLGVLAEQANRTLRRHPADFHASGVESPAAPYLGPVATDSDGLLQWIRIPDLLPPDVRALLFATEEAL